MDYFDYETAAREAGLTPEQLGKLQDVVRRDYPTDQMLFELHVLRACNAICEGRTTLVRILNSTVDLGSR